MNEARKEDVNQEKVMNAGSTEERKLQGRQKSTLAQDSGSQDVLKCDQWIVRLGFKNLQPSFSRSEVQLGDGCFVILPPGLRCMVADPLQLFLGLAASLSSGSLNTLCILVRNPLFG